MNFIRLRFPVQCATSLKLWLDVSLPVHDHCSRQVPVGIGMASKRITF